MGELLELGILVTLLAVGFFFGRVIERNHYASIRLREKQYRDVRAFTMRFPPDRVTAQEAFLVTGTVVVSADYFKTFVAGLRNLFGGRFRAYETLMERARREAMLRLKAEARRRGANLVVCVRFETTSITSGWAPSIEVFAYGTALIPATEAAKFVGTGRSRLLGEGSIRSARPLPR
ncbi:MAG: YbjQ family protein [Burkholderiaceae bacterium]|nr:YbjQ family protein [Burkholderiaceae bacterium]